jgi:hypothetical protein
LAVLDPGLAIPDHDDEGLLLPETAKEVGIAGVDTNAVERDVPPSFRSFANHIYRHSH